MCTCHLNAVFFFFFVMQDVSYWQAGWQEDERGQFWRACRGTISIPVSGWTWGKTCCCKHDGEGELCIWNGTFFWHIWRLETTKWLLVPHNFVWGSCFWFCIPGSSSSASSSLPGGALGLAWSCFGAAALCVAGVAQSHIHLRFTWQAWHRLTSTFVLRGRHGTYGTQWRAWAGLVAFWRRGTLRGRRGRISHPPSFHVAGVAQTHIHLRFAWQAWHLWHSVARLGWLGRVLAPGHFAWQAWHNLTSTFVSRGRRGTISHPPWFHVAGVAHMALGGALGLAWSRCGAAALCLAGVAHSHIHLRFTWQAWHKLTSTFVLRGRRGTYGTQWRAWAGLVAFWRRGTLRGRRGTILHPHSFRVAGVAQSPIHLGFTWQAWHTWHWVARLGWLGRVLAPRHFAWQAWHNLTSTFVSRGRRGTISHPLSFHVAGVAETLIHRRCTWQA